MLWEIRKRCTRPGYLLLAFSGRKGNFGEDRSRKTFLDEVAVEPSCKTEWVGTREFLTPYRRISFVLALESSSFQDSDKSKQLSSKSPAFHLVTELGPIGLTGQPILSQTLDASLPLHRGSFSCLLLQTEMVKQVSMLYAKAP